ncbi:putative sensor histidine kinase/response regulator [Talaromyces proteolyticus]|uniref:histidine kinase n=1 Tax=Talaromyces proteolyticus TaxID=1131652 RepID=A0AAD4PZB8_9EURO|nr:putative sensor histidine kinase/response regulator [Talaromyces proteolyticus]KAH8695519.1 putative sensor histidine kinase/response regulator [Talaromyces proteolyticus]
MRRNQARLTPTKAPSPSTAVNAHTHSRNPSRADPLSNSQAIADSPAVRTSRKDLSQPLPSPRPADQPTQDISSHSESNARTLEELRRRMEQTLANQQAQHHHERSSATPTQLSQQQTQISSQGSSPLTIVRSRSPSATNVLRSGSHTESSGSGTTIKGVAATSEKQADLNVPKTPSYPFPVMSPRSVVETASNPLASSDTTKNKSMGHIHESHRRSTKAPGTISMGPPRTIPIPGGSFFPPGSQVVPDDPLYPSPSLYEVILKLNSDPGLDHWWTNVVEILKVHFGAERASLAVPGDSTDLENVPWGQKAAFNAHGTQNYVDTTLPESLAASAGSATEEAFSDKTEEYGNASALNISRHSPPRRPSLLVRHSFAGFTKEKMATSSRSVERPLQNSRQKESFQKVPSEFRAFGSSTDITTSASRPPEDDSTKSILHPRDTGLQESSSTVVFRIPRDLETERDPLIKRTGITRLFCRNKPAVLTREYAYDPLGSSYPQGNAIAPVHSPNDILQTTPATEPPKAPDETSLKADIKSVAPPSRHGRSRSTTLNPHTVPSKKETPYRQSLQLYEDYEQTPPSPWSQSPAPSPAPRMHPDQNPFFLDHAVDEEAFAKNPPPHDYSQAEPVNAIGVDGSKTIVHIPLLHAITIKDFGAETLRFPLAIISFLSPTIPYPANLRTSLRYLIPHFTTSYSLAHQYSQLESQLAPGAEKTRFGNLLGLGGTFSDASSEMELFAGLSGQTMTDAGSVSARASLSSPGEMSSDSKASPSLSIIGTPGLELGNMGPASESNATLGLRYGIDNAESYFTLQRGRNFATPNLSRGRGSKSKSKFLPSVPTSPGVSRSKSTREVDSMLREPLVAEEGNDNTRPNLASVPTRTSSRNNSTSVIAQLHRDGYSISEHVFQLMLNSVPLHLFLAKAQTGEVIWTNSKFDTYRRSQPQDLAVRDPWQNVHPSELESLCAKWAKALQTGAQFTERVRVKRFGDDSIYRWFIFRANPLLSQTGQVVSWIGSFLDIHEQHVSELQAAQEREVYATNAKYRALANSIPQIVFEATEGRGLISANEQWQLYTGQSVEEAMNFGFTTHIHRDDLEKCGVLSFGIAELKSAPAEDRNSVVSSESRPGVAAFFAQGVTPALNELVNQGIVAAQKDENGRTFYTTELRLRSKGGDYRWHLVRLIKVQTTTFGDEEASWYGTCTDINDRKLLERELNRAMQKLNKEMESKSKFFSNMSHEIRTPLNGILGTIPFILETHLDNEQRRMLDTIQNSSTNLRELVDNILDVSRVEAGKMNLVNSWFHVRSVLEDAIDTIASRAIDKGLEINYLMDTDVPGMVIGDRFRIRQVLINLMGNAVKFTSQGEIYTRCSVLQEPSNILKATELLLNFEVVDTGKGFSTSDAEQLMQRFSQLGGNSSQQHSGSGLGLFLSKQLVEMHGGRLTPSSREGQGAKFSFYIKVDAPQHGQDPALIRHHSDLSETTTSSPRDSQHRMPLLTNNSTDVQILTLKDLSLPHDLSPLAEFSSSSDPSLQSGSNYRSSSSVSSAAHTPDFAAVEESSKHGLSHLHKEHSTAPPESCGSTVHPSPRGEKTLGSSYLRPIIYSVLILCPLDHAREAVKQHIEQVIPLEVPATTTALSDTEDWKDLRNASDSPSFSHLVLDVPETDEILEVFQHIQGSNGKLKPEVVIICDLYQKRQIASKMKELVSAGFKVDTVLKPVKPSAFSRIFDPDNRRDLSKDRNQDQAREVNNNFKTMSKMVKEVIGNKGYRILLVEDEETNRGVMLKYLDKVKLVSETASNGQECVDMVFSHEPGYYSLIICDIQMPIKNGYETCREIRAWEAKNHFPHIPIMALSANAMTDQIDDAARAGFNDYVTKPIKHNELGKMMMTLLDPTLPQVLLRERKDWRHDDPH